MCRHLAYLGEPRTLAELVVDRPHSLFEQSWAPARQKHGTVNVDGFGVGWYVDRPTPVRYRRAQPIWTDASFASLAPTISTSCAVAAVRSATEAHKAATTRIAALEDDKAKLTARVAELEANAANVVDPEAVRPVLADLAGAVAASQAALSPTVSDKPTLTIVMGGSSAAQAPAASDAAAPQA